MSVLSVKKLCKNYESFKLEDVSFDLEPGKITGFIGRNGAGKTTTLKSLLNFVHPDGGEINFFELPFVGNELQIKQRIGFVSGGIDYYTKKKLRVITDVTKRFYTGWDDAAYEKYMTDFSLSPEKTPDELSAGMRVKYALALALSHNAELLILDEPTSGLDPVSRDELLDVFLELADAGKTILFSTHITSDLDKCADNIIYIQRGKLLADCPMNDFVSRYRIADLPGDAPKSLEGKVRGLCRVRNGHTALIYTDDAKGCGLDCREADLEEIMVHLEKEEK